jgi:hypothetical protein
MKQTNQKKKKTKRIQFKVTCKKTFKKYEIN